MNLPTLITIFLLTTMLEMSLGCSSKSTSSKSTNSFKSSRKYPLESIPKAQLKFKMGDIISCTIPNDKAGSHMMLATSNSTVIHSPGGLPPDLVDTVIVEETYEHATSYFEYCGLKTETYDAEFRRSCSPEVIRTSDEAIKAARASLEKLKGRRTFYDAYKCNCEHWINSWKYGMSWCLQVNNWVFWANKKASPECEAPGKIQCT